MANLEPDRGTSVLIVGASNRGLATALCADSVRITPRLNRAVAILDSTRIDAVILHVCTSTTRALDRTVAILDGAGTAAVILITADEDPEFEARVLRLGVQACVPAVEATSTRIDRIVRQAITRTRRVATIERERDELHYLSVTDPLTKLANRRGIQEALNREIARAVRNGSELAAIFADFDDFKSINERFGHAAGDTVLAEAAARLRSALRPTDTLARVGGDEFVALLSGASESAAAAIAIRLRDVLTHRPIETGAGAVRATASFAVTTVPTHAADIATITALASHKLAEAKRSGKNRVAVQSPHASDAAPRALDRSPPRDRRFDAATG